MRWPTRGPSNCCGRRQAGDGPALGQLLESYRRYLLVLARLQIGRCLQGKVDAADMVQEAFLGAFRDFRQFRGSTEKEFLGWLRQILASLLANLVRHYQALSAAMSAWNSSSAANWTNPRRPSTGLFWPARGSPSQQAVRREQAVLLADALGRLPEDWRDLLILRHLEGLTFPEVAQRMGRTIDSVKKLWPRALAGFRRLIDG